MVEYVGTLRVPIGSTPARVAKGVRNMNLPGKRCLHAAVVVAVADSRHFCMDPGPRIRTIPLTNGSDSGSCYFHQWPSRWQLKKYFKLFWLIGYGTF